MRLHHVLALAAGLFQVAPAAQPGGRLTLTVRETAGIRRTQFPAMAVVPVPASGLTDAAAVMLSLNGTAVPVQSTVLARWPDASIRELAVDFNASPGANESLAYVLQYGAAVRPAAGGARGLTITEQPDAVRIGNVTFSRSGSPLITSVKYRDEAIGTGPNGLLVVDQAGMAHDLSAGRDMTLDIVKRGPLVAALRYTGSLPLAQAAVRFTVLAEMPSSKSWVKLSAHVDDPGRRVREIAFATPLALGPLPWTWDFGTTRWTYGSMRTAADRVVMSSSSAATTTPWTVVGGPEGREQTYESGPARSTFGGWAHLQGAREVVAFAIDRAPEFNGTTRVTFDGAGHAEFALTPGRAVTRHDLVVYEHFVASPVQIGAATSPAAILSPLIVSVK
jgi:hypothetical protein